MSQWRSANFRIMNNLYTVVCWIDIVASSLVVITLVVRLPTSKSTMNINQKKQWLYPLNNSTTQNNQTTHFHPTHHPKKRYDIPGTNIHLIIIARIPLHLWSSSFPPKRRPPAHLPGPRFRSEAFHDCLCVWKVVHTWYVPSVGFCRWDFTVGFLLTIETMKRMNPGFLEEMNVEMYHGTWKYKGLNLKKGSFSSSENVQFWWMHQKFLQLHEASHLLIFLHLGERISNP